MESHRKIILIGSLLALAAVGLFVYLFVLTPKESPKTTPDIQKVVQPGKKSVEKPKAEEDKEERIQRPELEPVELDLSASDDPVRSLAGVLSQHSQWGKWLEKENLIRRFVAVVDNIATGESPAYHLSFLQPSQPFVVHEEGDRMLVDPKSYQRYDGLTEVILSLDMKSCSELYYRLEPNFEKAFSELGHPEISFQKRLRVAMKRIFNIPVTTGLIEVKKKVVAYRYVDPQLENLTAAQKHFLRMGPENLRKIQSKLKELYFFLGFDH